MTGLYNTPKVLHLQECDQDGNKRIVRYYREDSIEFLADSVKRYVEMMKDEADAPQTDCGWK